MTLQGHWKAVLERTKGYKAAAEDERLTLAAWHLFALAKLRMYREAESAFAGLGDLDAPHYMRQSPEGGPLHSHLSALTDAQICADFWMAIKQAWRGMAVGTFDLRSTGFIEA